MKNDEKKKQIERIPNIYRKAWILGSCGAAIGAGIGAYISIYTGSEVFIIVGVLVGAIIGDVIGLIIGRRININQFLLSKTEKIMNITLGFFSIILGIIGMLMFLMSGKRIGIYGAIFLVSVEFIFY